MSIFEKATREKVRFHTPQGVFTVEDLWDLPLQSKTGRLSLDSIAITLSKQLRDSSPISFVDASEANTANEDIKLRFDIVLHIINVKKIENARAAELAAARKQDQTILAAIADRERQDLLSLPLEELRKRLSTATATTETTASA